MFLAIAVEFSPLDRLHPDPAARALDKLDRCAFQLNAPARENRHPRAEIDDVSDDVRREDDDDILANLAEEIEKAITLFRIKPRRRLVHDDQIGIAYQGLRDPEALPHAARKTRRCLLANVPQIHLAQ